MMISSNTPYKLAEIIRDTWPNIYRPAKEIKQQVKLPIDEDCKEV